MSTSAELESLRSWLNADLFDKQYPLYFEKWMRGSRDDDGVPQELSESADALAADLAQDFWQKFVEAGVQLTENGIEPRQTVHLQDGSAVRVELRAVGALVSLTALAALDSQQARIIAGLTKLLAGLDTRPIFVALAFSVYVIWTCETVRDMVPDNSYRSIDLLQNYMNVALGLYQRRGHE